MVRNRYFFCTLENFATIVRFVHTLLSVNLFLMEPRPTTSSTFGESGASCGPTLSDKESVVCIVHVVLAVSIALSTSNNTTNVLRNESNRPPYVLFVSD